MNVVSALRDLSKYKEKVGWNLFQKVVMKSTRGRPQVLLEYYPGIAPVYKSGNLAPGYTRTCKTEKEKLLNNFYEENKPKKSKKGNWHSKWNRIIKSKQRYIFT